MHLGSIQSKTEIEEAAGSSFKKGHFMTDTKVMKNCVLDLKNNSAENKNEPIYK